MLGLAAAMGGVLSLRRSWRKSLGGARQGLLLMTGWALAAASIALMAAAMGMDRGITAGVCLVGVIAYGLIAVGTEVRKARAGRGPPAAAEPLDPLVRPMRIARASLRCFSAVVLAATASLALAAAWSLRGPGLAVDRVVTAAYILPLIWGASMTWSLSDERLRRPTIGLALLTVAGLALVYLPGGGA
jgi:hypothetical protein